MAELNKIEQYNKGAIFPSNYDETYIATKHISKEPLAIPNDVSEKLKKAIDAKNLYFGDDTVLNEILIGIIKGNIILQGPPGTGKTTLAKILCDVFNTSSTEITAISDWTTYDTIGGIQPTVDENGNETFDGKNGLIVNAILKSCNTILQNKNPDNEENNVQADWLIIDELNRCEIDKVFGDLFTAFGNDDVSIEKKISLWFHKNPNKKELYIPNKFRIIGAMNNTDKDFVFNISQGLSRRFTFITILPPNEQHFSNEIENAKKISEEKALKKLSGFKYNIDTTVFNNILTSSEFKNADNLINLLLKQIRYNHEGDDSYLGFQLGTAQIIDLYESIFIALIVTNYNQSSDKNNLITDIIDSQISNKIIPQLDGFDYSKLTSFIKCITNDNKYKVLSKTISNLAKLV